MRRNVSLRIGTLLLVAFISAAPAFAAAPRDDSPGGRVSEVISRVVRSIRRIFKPLDTTGIDIPRP